MIKAKDCLHSLSRLDGDVPGTGSVSLEAGCSSISGLRSVGTERPSFTRLLGPPRRARRLPKTTLTC